MKKNRSTPFLICITCVLSIILLQVMVTAEWTPGTYEIAPSKDTYVSIDGALSEPLSNFGGAESLTIGDGFDGVCVTAIYFDLTTLPEDALTLNFDSDIFVYGESTRTLKVFILLNTNWNELSVTGLDNPFNATEIWIAETIEANCSLITITGSTDEVNVNITDWMDSSSVTLLFTFGVLDESWITMSSKENSYLYSTSNPPHLTYTVPSSGEPDLGIPGYSIMVTIIAISISIVLIKKKINLNK